MANEIVFDIETQNGIAIDGVQMKDLRVSVVVAYEYATGIYHSFKEDELKNLWPLLEHADRIIGYNSLGFDIPVLNNYYPGDLLVLHHLDMLVEVKKNLGHRLRLNDIAKATLKIEKSGEGLQAIEWFKQGNWEDLIRYCTDDVKITKEIYEFGKKNKQLFYSDMVSGQLRPFPVNFDMPTVTDTPRNVNLSLPF